MSTIEEAKSPRSLEILERCLEAAAVCYRDRAGEDPAEWPADLQIRELPTVAGSRQ